MLEDLADFCLRGLFLPLFFEKTKAAMEMLPHFALGVFFGGGDDKGAEEVGKFFGEE